MSSKSKGSIEIPLLLFFIVAAITGYLIIYKNNILNTVTKNETNKIVNLVTRTTPSPTPSPTPFPFQELTIPYLRNRDYSSKLGELTKYNENSNYTSYLTNYDSDGLKINGLLTIPNGPAPSRTEGGAGWPAIVFIHGYIPPTVYQTTQNYASYVDYLSKNGFVVFKIDLRGHDDSEGVALGAYYSGAYIIDTLNAYSALQNAEFVNKNRIGLWGHSMGGNVVFRSFVAKQNIPAVNIWAGAVYNYTDMEKYRINDNSYRPPADETERQKYRDELRAEYGSFTKGNWFWDQVNPVNYLDGVTGAISINHAVNDDVVNIGYSRDIMKILDNTNITHELNEYQSGGHNISGNNFNAAMESTVEFFKKYL